MLFLKNKEDLEKVLQNPALFARDPVFLHLPELPPDDLIGYERRINALKKENGKSPGGRIAVTTLAVLSGIYLNTAYFSETYLLSAILIILGLSLTGSIAGLILYHWYLRKRIRYEIKKLLKRLLQPQPDPLIMAVL